MTKQKKPTHLSHDRFVKRVLSDPKVARDFFEKNLPSPLLRIINLDTLKIEPGSFIDPALKRSETDMLFSVEAGDEKLYLYTLLEHQSKPEHWMLLRKFRYELDILEQYKTQNPDARKLPLIYTIIFYTGDQPYTAPTDFFELFNDPVHARDIFNQPCPLIDLQKIDDTDLKKQTIAGVFQLFMKHIREREFLPFFEQALPLLHDLEKQGLLEYIEAIICYTIYKAEIPDKKRFIQDLQTRLTPEIGENIMTLAQQFIAEGIEKGIEKEKLMVAQRLLKEGLPIDLVAKATELTQDELKKLSEQLH